MKDEQFELLMKSVNEMKDLLEDMNRQEELEAKWNSISYEGVPTNPDKYIITTCEEKQL